MRHFDRQEGENSEIDIDKVVRPRWSYFDHIIQHSDLKMTDGWPDWFKKDIEQAKLEVKNRMRANKLITQYMNSNAFQKQ